MNRVFNKKKTTARIFIMMVFIYAMFDLQYRGDDLKEIILGTQWNKDGIIQLVSNLDSEMGKNAFWENEFNDLYGYIQLVLNKEEIGEFEIVKDKDGKLHYSRMDMRADIRNTLQEARYVNNLKKQVEDNNTEFLYVMPPAKYIRDYTQFSKGLPENLTNETADSLLGRLKNYDITYLDLREYIEESDIEKSELFYNTDGNIKTPTAFWAANVLSDFLENNYGEKLDKEGFYKDADNYNSITYNDIMLGSMGKVTGRFFTDVDDFTLIYPKFATNFLYESSMMGDAQFIGRFEEALLDTTIIRRSNKPYETDLNSVYLYGNSAFTHIENQDNKDGINVCIIKDDFAQALATFFSLRCKTVDLIDVRLFDEDYVKKINSGNYDYVIIMISPENINEKYLNAE